MEKKIKIHTEHLKVSYHTKKVINDISLGFPENSITAIIGPSGCGKSTLLRCMNRLFELIPNVAVSGNVIFEDKNIYEADTDLVALRRKIGMVFQKPNPFPKSIYDNIAYGLKINGMGNKKEISQRVEESLIAAGIWDEIKDRLHDSALQLSGGQQQRLCIARTIAVKPEVILMDEPCSALDPSSTFKVEELMIELKKDFTILLVTHNMQQAARSSDFTGFLYMGDLIEFGETKPIFTNPKEKLTEDYISGRFG